MFCDLHTHSTFSDGTFSHTEIVLKAKEIGLDAVVAKIACERGKRQQEKKK